MNHLEKFRNVSTFIFDVDGVLTDSSVLVMEDGQLLRQMNIRDGYAIRRAIEAGYHFCVITGGRSEGVKTRLTNLGVRYVYSGISDKKEAYDRFLEGMDIDPETILYMGDDLPDHPVMRRVGVPVCPKNAATEIIAIAAYVSHLEGGAGCARDVIEKVMRLQGTWESD